MLDGCPTTLKSQDIVLENLFRGILKLVNECDEVAPKRSIGVYKFKLVMHSCHFDKTKSPGFQRPCIWTRKTWTDGLRKKIYHESLDQILSFAKDPS